jgi:hypothetical protein
MKKIGLWVACLALLSLPARAQVSVELTFEQDQFLRGEAIKAAVRISNLSGRDLHLGADEDWLTFTVESRDGGVVQKLADVPVEGEFVVESAQRATKRLNLEPYFSFNQSGRYSVIANVRLKEWNQDRKSAPKSFYVIEGTKLWEQEFGLPRAAGSTNEAPEVRKYTLQQANYIKNQLRLYLRVSDSSGAHVFRTVPIGTVLSFSHPEPRLDKLSNLHVIYQSWAKIYSYSVFNPDGELLARETYDYADTRPRLGTDDDGTVSVIGGVKRVRANEGVVGTPAPTSSPP